ncbi:hypothetical protein LCGC14_1657470 [marine sediment metagenome]|uniref:Uncharacterized protein n=1 Tax=marine sediment metagenome TaxID=412755 RepID=A0A0F9KV80_9ZZZZ
MYKTYKEEYVKAEKQKSFNVGFYVGVICSAFILLFTLLLGGCEKEETIIPQTRFNTTFDLLTNGGTSKPWKLDSISTNSNNTFILAPEWYEADYTYYVHNLMTITHPRYNTITMDYILYLDSLVIFGYYDNVPAVLKFKVDNISEKKLQLTRRRYANLIVTEYYTRK